MNSEQIGIVKLEDLQKKEIFISLKKEFHKELERNIRNYGIFKICNELEISNRIICHWLNDNSLIRFDILYKITNFLNYDLKDKIEFIRGKKGICIYNPKSSFNFRSKEGVRIIASILGDGGIPYKKSNPYYTNTNENQIKGFLKDLEKVFGTIKYSINEYKKKNTVIKIIRLPILTQKIFFNLGIKKGKKIESNQEIPKYILNLEEEKLYEFISQIFDDEGSVSIPSRHLCIKLVSLNKYEKDNLIEGIKNILQKLRFSVDIYSRKKENNRIEWSIEIHRRDQINKLFNRLNLRNDNKRKKIELLLNNYKQNCYSHKECKNIYFNYMKKIENGYGYFTTETLAKELNRSVGHIRNIIAIYKKQRLINCIEEYKSGNLHNFAKYKVINDV